MIVDDAELVALIDDELDDEAKARLLAQLAADEGLRQRYEAFARRERTPLRLSTRCSERRRFPGSAPRCRRKPPLPARWRRCHVWTPLADQGLFLALRGSWGAVMSSAFRADNWIRWP